MKYELEFDSKRVSDSESVRLKKAKIFRTLPTSVVVEVGLILNATQFANAYFAINQRLAAERRQTMLASLPEDVEAMVAAACDRGRSVASELLSDIFYDPFSRTSAL